MKFYVNIYEAFYFLITEILEERIKKAAEIRMAKFMKEEGISYMEYAVKVGDKVISGSTSIMKIKSITYISDEYKDAAVSIFVISIFMFMLTVFLAVVIRKQMKKSQEKTPELFFNE